MKMKKDLLKMALLAFATFAASVASAQSGAPDKPCGVLCRC